MFPNICAELIRHRANHIPNSPRATLSLSSRPSRKSVIPRTHIWRDHQRTTCIYICARKRRDKVCAKSAQLCVPGKCVNALVAPLWATLLSGCMPTHYAVSCLVHALADYSADARVRIYIRVIHALATAITKIEFLAKECSIRTTTKLAGYAINIV